MSYKEKNVFYVNYIITQYLNKIKTRRSPGTNIFGVPGIKEIRMI